MLEKKRRIRKTAFKDLLEKGMFGSSPIFSVRFSRSPMDEKSSFAVVVSKKVAKTAVERNKIRRRCYHALRDLEPKIKNSYKIVFFAKKGIEARLFNDLSNDIRAILSKNNLIH